MFILFAVKNKFIVNSIAGPNLIRKPAPAQEQKVILENLPSQTVKQQNEEGKAINHTTVEGKEINLSEEEINEIVSLNKSWYITCLF